MDMTNTQEEMQTNQREYFIPNLLQTKNQTQLMSFWWQVGKILIICNYKQMLSSPKYKHAILEKAVHPGAKGNPVFFFSRQEGL